jgi:hypothetical protein
MIERVIGFWTEVGGGVKGNLQWGGRRSSWKYCLEIRERGCNSLFLIWLWLVTRWKIGSLRSFVALFGGSAEMLNKLYLLIFCFNCSLFIHIFFYLHLLVLFHLSK